MANFIRESVRKSKQAEVETMGKGMKQPVETALVNIVKAATPSLEKVPIEYRAELEAKEDLGDEELWKVADQVATPAKQRRLANLLDKNQSGKLTDREHQALRDLRAECERLMLRRSFA